MPGLSARLGRIGGWSFTPGGEVVPEMNQTEKYKIEVLLEKRDDWFTVTAPSYKGFYMSWNNKKELIDDIPKAFALWYESKHGQKVDPNTIEPVIIKM